MVFSAARSARLTKSPAPLVETCRFSTSPKSLMRPRPALRAALSMTLRLALPCMIGLLGDQGGAIRRVAGAGKGASAPSGLREEFADQPGDARGLFLVREVPRPRQTEMPGIGQPRGSTFRDLRRHGPVAVAGNQQAGRGEARQRVDERAYIPLRHHLQGALDMRA